MKLLSPDLVQIQSGGQALHLRGLFLPMFFELLLKTLLSAVSVLILGRYSDSAVASVGVASQVLAVITMLSTVTATGALVVINQNLGAGHPQRAAQVAGMAIAIGGAISLVIGLGCSLFAPRVIGVLRLEPALEADAITFLRVTALSAILQGPLTALSATCNSNGYPRISMAVALFMNAVNLIGSALVVFSPFPFPLTGVLGVAVARGVSEVMALLLMVRLVRRSPISIVLPRAHAAGAICRDIFRIGVPGGIESLSYNLSQLVVTGLVGSLGTVAVATRVYALNINSFVYLPGMALAQATALMVGRLVGAGDHERAIRLNRQVLRLTLAVNTTLAALMVLLRYPLLRMFTQAGDIIALGAQILCIDFFAEVFRSATHVETNCLRAAGDVRFTMAACTISSWAITALCSWLLAVVLGLGLHGIWLAIVLDEALRGSALRLRWHSRKWAGKLPSPNEHPAARRTHIPSVKN